MHEGIQGEMSTATTPRLAADGMSAFTCQEWVSLLQLRRRYRDGHDQWSARELEHLRFVRWLHTTHRLKS
jgi:hypothetical protein